MSIGYDFSEMNGMDVSEDGLYHDLNDISDYYNKSDYYSYLIKVDNEYAGLAVIRLIENNKVNYLRHFFIMRKFQPSHILNYFDIWDNQVLNTGLVLAIETFISTGAEYVVEDIDGWTLKTPDKSIVAQFEHTIIVMENEPIILTA